jgi:hypothetical protein
MRWQVRALRAAAARSRWPLYPFLQPDLFRVGRARRDAAFLHLTQVHADTRSLSGRAGAVGYMLVANVIATALGSAPRRS